MCIYVNYLKYFVRVTVLHKPRTTFDYREPPREDSYIPFIPSGDSKGVSLLKLLPIQTRIRLPTYSKRSELQRPGKSASMEIFFVSLYYRLFYFIVLGKGGLYLLKVREKEKSKNYQRVAKVIYA